MAEVEQIDVEVSSDISSKEVIDELIYAIKTLVYLGNLDLVVELCINYYKKFIKDKNEDRKVSRIMAYRFYQRSRNFKRWQKRWAIYNLF